MSEREREPRGYEDVRSVLLGKGYLETPLERFFIGTTGAALGRGIVGSLVVAALSGALGGAALGVLLAFVVIVQSDGAIPWWPDGVLYAALFAPVLGFGVAVAELFAGVLMRALSRGRTDFSPRRASLAAGAVVAALLALYLGGWWARAGAAFDASGILALLALALGAGFAGRVVSAAVLAQAMIATGRTPRAPARTALTTAALATLIALGAGGASVLARGIENRRGEPAMRADAATSRVVVLAWDGLGGEIAHGLVREGRTPALASLLGASDWWTVAGSPGADPAARWTTVATGCDPSIHGVVSVDVDRLRGASAPAVAAGPAAGPLSLLSRLWPTDSGPVRSGVRAVPAVWEVSADAVKTGVIGWWGTWPASSPGRAGGYVVSDGALLAARDRKGLETAIYPGAWGSSRAPAWLIAAETALGDSLPRSGDEGADELAREALVIDLFALAAAEDALADPELEVIFVHLPGLDIVRTGWQRRGIDLLMTIDRIRAHATALDARLAEGRLAETLRSAEVALVALPGRAGQGQGIASWAPSRGAAVHNGASIPMTDLAALWLARAGLPIDDRLCGARADAISPFVAGPVRIERTTASPARPASAEPEIEHELLERLRSLGYVE